MHADAQRRPLGATWPAPIAENSMTYLEICQAQLPKDEGYQDMPYKDSLGILSIGIGRNLEKGLSQDEIIFLFGNDLKAADKAARAVFPSFDSLSETRKAVLVNMAFNMGQSRLSGFVKMFGALADGKYDEAADQMLASKWAVQVGSRAQRLAAAMREG